MNTLKAAPQPKVQQFVNVMYTPIIVVNNIYNGKAVHALNLNHKVTLRFLYLASQDALEVMRVTSLSHLLTYWVIVSIDFTDVTLVSDDIYRRLYWCDPDYPDDPDESYQVMKVI